MEKVKLQAEKREVGKGAARRVRYDGSLPAVLYGRGVQSVALKIDQKSFERVYSTLGRNVLIELGVKGDRKKTPRTVMVKEVQRDPVMHRLLHVDFYQVSLKEKVHTRVPIIVVGDEQAAKTGGIIQHQAREIEVECLPTDIPEKLVADISALTIGDHFVVGSLSIPDGVKLLSEPDELVVTIVAPKAAEEAAAPAGEGEAEAEGGEEEGEKAEARENAGEE